MALESLPKIAPALFSAEQDLIQIYNKKSDTTGVINPSYIKSSPSGVSGAIQFSDGSAFASDASNLFWDNVNKRLGVGTNAPVANLHIIGANQLANTYNTKIEGASGFGIFSIANDGAAQIGDYTGNGFQSSLYFLRPSGASRASRLIQGNADLTLTNAVGGFVMNGLQCTIKGSGSTSATTSLLVQNSAGTELFRVRDDGRLSAQSINVTGFPAYLISNVNVMDYGSGLRIGYDGSVQQITFYTNSGTPQLAINNSNQVSVGTTSPQASAKFEIASTTLGFLPPRLSTSQKTAIASPAAGLMVYDTNLNKLCVYNGSAWETITSV